MTLQHSASDARANTLIQQRYSRRRGYKVSNRRLEFLHQARLVRGENSKLKCGLDESTSPQELAPLTSLMILINIQLLEEVVNRWNNWGASGK